MACTYREGAGNEWSELPNAYKDIDRLKGMLYRKCYILYAATPIIYLLEYGFADENIAILSDKSDRHAELPTRANIV